ncbi:MAG: hypothetical protein HY422_00810 [Candidatus Komeilibacteria bacterium]|nr:hypothetical protein [Candidatus Komeilibacteria bacterium]
MSFSSNSMEYKERRDSGEDHVITKADENALFRLQLALSSVDKRIDAGEDTAELKDARDMLQSQVELLEHILVEEDESERAELEQEFRDLVKSTEDIRRRWRSSEEIQ